MKTRLQELRKAAGYKSARDFADANGINVNTYTGYEQGKPMSLDQLWEFADIFDVSLDYLVGRDYEKAAPEDAPEIMAAYGKLDDTGKAYATRAVEGMAGRMDS